MATNQSGQNIIQSGESDSNRDTLEDIYLGVNNDSRLERIATNIYHLKNNRVLNIQGFVDFSGQTLIVNGDDNNLRITSGGNFKAGTKLEEGVFKDKFTLIYLNACNINKQHTTVASATDSFNSGGAILNIQGMDVIESNTHGYSGFNLTDTSVDNVIEGLSLNLRNDTYTNINISAGTVLSIENLRNSTIRDTSGVAFKIKSWNGGEAGDDIVKLLGSGTIENLNVNYTDPASTIQIADADFNGGNRIFKNSYLELSRLTGYDGIKVDIVTTFTFNFFQGSNPLPDANIYLKANSDDFEFINNISTLNNSSIDIEQWTGTRVGAGTYEPFNSAIVDRTDLLIGAIRYDSFIDLKSSLTNYLGPQEVVFSLPEDLNITESDKNVVDTYTELESSSKLYDKSKAYLVDNYKGEGVLILNKAAETIDLGSYDLLIDNLAAQAFDLTSNLITIRANVFTGNLITTGTVSFANGSSINGGIVDSNGDSYISFDNIDSWEVYSDSGKTILLDSGTNIFRFTYSPATTYYITAFNGGVEFDLTSTPTSQGETIVTLNSIALLLAIQNTLNTDHEEIKIYTKKASDNSEENNQKFT